MLNVEMLVQLIGSGNKVTVEEEWMRLIESADVPLAQLASYGVVLAELCRVGKQSDAEAYAWAAIEAVVGRTLPRDALKVAGPFLLAVGKSEELRSQVANLYRSAYEGQDGLEELLAESGIEGGRPVRRALRTLELVLNLEEGGFLTARDEDNAVQVKRIDRSTWAVEISHGDDTETLGVVHLADRYELASATDFRVMRRFAWDALVERLANDPIPFIIDLCRQNDHHIDSEQLQAWLVPELLTEAEWKKWFTRARSALKRCVNLRLTGRSPYVMTYVESPATAEEELQADFSRAREPSAQLALVETYLRDCKLRREQPSVEAITQCYDSYCQRARTQPGENGSQAALLWLMARCVGEAIGLEGAADGAVRVFRETPDVARIFRGIKEEPLLELACTTLIEAHPTTWTGFLLALLPTFPAPICDQAAARLVAADRTRDDFDPLVQQIIGSPVTCFEALLWLWDGPTDADRVTRVAPLTVLVRILKALEEAKRSDQLTKERVKRMDSRARSALAARKYERFVRCVDGLEPAMASALRTQLRRMDGLGRAVREHLLDLVQRRFPSLVVPAAVAPPWQREDVLFVTERGLVRKRAELEHHINVTMRDNARAIGEAAERGDLSENSEYKFALEERDLLRARLAQMNAELAIATVLAPEEVPTDYVGIGTRVVLKRLTDAQRYEMSFAGPWEADLDRCWFNYQVPLAQTVMGKRIGEKVELNHADTSGTYEIVELHNALAE